MSKQYGLILPNKLSKDHPILPVSKSHSIFNEDSDSDTPSVAKPTGSQTVKRQDKLNQQKAVEEDPTVYQYDEIYDEMEQQKKESKLAKKDEKRKPKYINRLLAAADKRKRENERRIERQVQKEREEEGDMYKDKESFITSAYKKKLEEMKKLEEEEKREAYLESIGDVTKQGNLDGFYRHLYEQKVKYDDDKEIAIKQEVKEEPKTDSENESSKLGTPDNSKGMSTSTSPQRNLESNMNSSDSDSINSKNKSKRNRSPSTLKENTKFERTKKSRNYRTRKDSDQESVKNEDDHIKKEHLPSNIDADSDFSIDSSDDETDPNPTSDKIHTNEKPPESVKETPAEEKALVDTSLETTSKNIKEEGSPKIKKPKIDIWKKRTVGEKFDEAVRRYFERKANREMGL